MLITSISGIRGTIGDIPGENLTPLDVVNFVSAYGSWVKEHHASPAIIVGRDARGSGSMIASLVVNTLASLGIHVLDLGLATTPTVEMMVIQNNAHGAVIITASHNPKEYNGLKMLDEHGEFLSAEQGQAILDRVQDKNYRFADIDNLGMIERYHEHHQHHVQAILDLELVDVESIKKRKFKIVLDGINSVGGIAVLILLKELGVEVITIHCEADGNFAHNPEPLEKNLGDLMNAVREHNADLGIAVDPDVDRLVFVDETGTMFGEEYTLVAVADYVLSKTPGNTVSNLSSSRALRDIAEKYNVQYSASKVGEKNVVEMMKETNAIIGGEGSGGIIYPTLHYGRDALVGVGLFLSHLAESLQTTSELRSSYPNYFMAKEKVTLDTNINPDTILQLLEQRYQSEDITTIDGLKIDFVDSWVHMRKSNTEPILRIYTEAKTQDEANNLAQRFIDEIQALV